jgi:ectoine hydroxylase-related dioxygenase (phytanoyl-CoA dioxygenase family)
MAGTLSRAEIERFRDQGYLAVEGVLGEDDLAPLRQEYSELLDAVARRLHAQGAIRDTYADLPFAARYPRVLGEYPQLYKFLNISLPLINEEADPEDWTMHAGGAVFALLRHPRILDVVESIIGPEISSNPVQHVRLKPPATDVPGDVAEYSNIGVTTWHQDYVSLLDEVANTNLLTVWVAVTDATVENGCLVCVAGSHRNGLTQHQAGVNMASEPFIPPETIDQDSARPLPLERGGVILFDKFTHHASLPNRSDGLRWSFDLRYNPTGQATGRPAFPGFVARSRENPDSELRDPKAWAAMWEDARRRILSGEYAGPVFEQARWEA